MDSHLKSIFESGSKILGDTKSAKAPASKKGRAKLATEAQEPPETDPHKIFVKRAIREKPKSAEMIKDMKKFIEEAERHL